MEDGKRGRQYPATHYDRKEKAVGKRGGGKLGDKSIKRIGASMSKLPAIQFYVGDWKKDSGVQSLSYHDRGVWFEILCLMHESDQRGKLLLNGKKMPEDALARVLGLDNQSLTTTLTTLLTYGVTSVCEETGALCSRRMIRDEKLRQIRKEAGSKGGNPILVNQKSTTGVKQNPTPSSSSSVSIDILSDFESFWQKYPRHEKKKEAEKAYVKAIKISKHEEIMAGVEKYLLNKPSYADWAHPSSWLNGERWKDSYESKVSTIPKRNTRNLEVGTPEWEQETGMKL